MRLGRSNVVCLTLGAWLALGVCRAEASIALLGCTNAGATNNATTGSVDTTGANLITATAAQFGLDTSMSDSQGGSSNTWTTVKTQTNGSPSVAIFEAWNPAHVGSGHTFTLSTGGTFPGLVVCWWSGAQTSSDPVDGTPTGAANATNPGSITPTGNCDLFVGTIGGDGATWDSVTESTVFTLPTNGRIVYAGGAHEGAQQWYQINTDTTARNPTWGTSGTVAQAAFKAASCGGVGGAGSPYTQTFSLLGVGMSILLVMGGPVYLIVHHAYAVLEERAWIQRRDAMVHDLLQSADARRAPVRESEYAKLPERRA